MGKVHSLKRVQLIPAGMKEVWSYFSNPSNLQSITPKSMKFRIISQHHGSNIYAGQVIEYKVSPVPAIPLYWMTEITHVEQEKYFVDEQRFGPYSLWHHQHHFRQTDAGVEMTDIVHYKLPLWILGDLAHVLFVKRKLENIFDYRHQKINEVFGKQ